MKFPITLYMQLPQECWGLQRLCGQWLGFGTPTNARKLPGKEYAGPQPPSEGVPERTTFAAALPDFDPELHWCGCPQEFRMWDVEQRTGFRHFDEVHAVAPTSFGLGCAARPTLEVKVFSWGENRP